MDARASFHGSSRFDFEKWTSSAGVVRDLEYSGALVQGSAELLTSTLAAALDDASLPGPQKQAAAQASKATGAINCCGPGDGTRAGGMPPPPPPSRQPPVTITGVAPWAQPAGWKPGKGLDRVGPLGLKGGGVPPRPMGGGMGRGGFTAGGGPGAAKPMTVAPWAQAPGSSIGSALAKVAASKSAMAHNSSGAAGTSGGTSAQVDGAAAACTFVRDVLAAEECSAIAAALESDAAAMQTLAAAGHSIVDRLCALGSNSAARSAPTELGAPPAAPSAAPPLNEEEQEMMAKALKGALVSFYTRFPSLRAALRLKVANTLLAEIHNCQQIKASHMGLRLHALDTMHRLRQHARRRGPLRHASDHGAHRLRQRRGTPDPAHSGAPPDRIFPFVR